MSYTDKLMALSCPYTDNPYQNGYKRVVFVCSAGLLRSATAAAHFSKTKGWNTRACGSHDYALIPLSTNLIVWAHHIVFVNGKNYDSSMAKFADVRYQDNNLTWHPVDEMLNEKSIILNVPDIFSYNEQGLIDVLERQLNGVEI